MPKPKEREVSAAEFAVNELPPLSPVVDIQRPDLYKNVTTPPHALNLVRVKLESVAAEMCKGNTVQAYELLRQTQEFVNYELAKK